MGASKGHFVTRRTKGKKDLSILEAPKAQLDYAKQFNAVDKNDRDSSDFTTSISMRTNCWYLRVFFWIFDRVIHLVYKSTTWCYNLGTGVEEYKKYTDKHDGR